jgi:ACS family tartrate transporter-like MFS transporter
LINSLGNLGGFASPYAVGILVDKTGDSKYGLLMLAAVLLITAIATFLYGRKIHAGKVPPLSEEELLAEKASAVTPRETRP